MENGGKMKNPSLFKKVLFMALISSSVFAAGCKNHNPEARIEKMSKRIANKLDFNDQQKALLDQMTAELKKDFAAEVPFRQTLQDELKKQVNQPELDQAKLVQLIRERQARMDAKLEKYVAKIAEIHKTLNPEQKAEVLEKLDKFSRYVD